MISRVPIPRFTFLTSCLCLALVALGRCADEPFPEKPAGQIEDLARALLPEKRAALDAYLTAGARERGISVYVLTVPSLGVPPSRQPQRLSALAHRYAERWLPGAIGVVILFDDESGQVMVVGTKETDRRFPPWSRNLSLAEPLREIEQSGALAREKLEKTATTVLQIISQLQEQARAEAQKKRNISLAMGAIVLAGLAVILRSALRRKTIPRPSDSQSREPSG